MRELIKLGLLKLKVMRCRIQLGKRLDAAIIFRKLGTEKLLSAFRYKKVVSHSILLSTTSFDHLAT